MDTEDNEKVDENQSGMLYYKCVLFIAFIYFLFSVYFPFAKLL